MSKYGGPDVSFVQVGGYNLVAVLEQLRVKKFANLEDTRPLGGAWPTPEDIGTRGFELDYNGWYDDASDSINASINSTVGSSAVVSIAPGGNTVGKPFIGCQGPFKADYERLLTLEGFHKAKATYRGNGRVDEGIVLQPRATKTADWDTEGAESHDNSASSASGGAAYLQVEALSLDTATGLVVKVRHSADDVTYADKATFTTVTTARTAERIAIAGTINRYTAVSGDFTDTPGSPSAVVSVGLARH